MRSTAQIAGHPIHPMLVLVPAGTFVATLVFDIAYLAGGDAIWWRATIPSIIVGIVGGLVAAIPGFIDYVTVVRRGGAARIGLAHMILNLTLITVFAINLAERLPGTIPPARTPAYTGLWLSLVGFVILGISGWMGGAMVYEHRVGVSEPPAAREVPPGTPRRDIAAD